MNTINYYFEFFFKIKNNVSIELKYLIQLQFLNTVFKKLFSFSKLAELNNKTMVISKGKIQC